MEREQAAISRFFGQSYLASSALGYILIGLLLLGGFGLRYFLRNLVALPADVRRETVLKGLDGVTSDRRNLLPWLISICALVFVADLINVLDSAIGIGYLLAVILALSSNRHWHVTLIAGISVALMLASPILSPYQVGWWSYLESHAVAVFAIFVTAFFGAANMRKAQAETRALTEAMRSKNETAELRAALERAEAAEANNRRMVERMRMANESAGLSVWEWNIETDMIVIDQGGPIDRTRRRRARIQRPGLHAQVRASRRASGLAGDVSPGDARPARLSSRSVIDSSIAMGRNASSNSTAGSCAMTPVAPRACWASIGTSRRKKQPSWKYRARRPS